MTRLDLLRTDGAVRRRGVEWPSILLCGGVYGAFLGLTFWHAALPLPVFLAATAMVLALQSSMQHEFIHGHPTPWRRVNRALAFVPLCLWLPFESYRRVHLVHHRDDRLTDPFDDPESYYWSSDDWAALGPLGRAFIKVHSTLAGRLVFGPAWNISRYLVAQAQAMMRGGHGTRRIWLSHSFGCVVVLAWVVGVCHVDALVYLFGIVYPAASILMLRSFAEHRAEDDVPERTAIVENATILGFLFLFNNLHAAHHESPLVPWYELPRWYRRNRDRLVKRNGGLVYDGYGQVARRYLFTPHHVSVHPSQGMVSTLAEGHTVLRRNMFRRPTNFRTTAAKIPSTVTQSVS